MFYQVDLLINASNCIVGVLVFRLARLQIGGGGGMHKVSQRKASITAGLIIFGFISGKYTCAGVYCPRYFIPSEQLAKNLFFGIKKIAEVLFPPFFFTANLSFAMQGFRFFRGTSIRRWWPTKSPLRIFSTDSVFYGCGK